MKRPSMDKASWVLSELRNAGTIPEGTCGALSRIFREDLYHAAELSIGQPPNDLTGKLMHLELGPLIPVTFL